MNGHTYFLQSYSYFLLLYEKSQPCEETQSSSHMLGFKKHWIWWSCSYIYVIPNLLNATAHYHFWKISVGLVFFFPSPSCHTAVSRSQSFSSQELSAFCFSACSLSSITAWVGFGHVQLKVSVDKKRGDALYFCFNLILKSSAFFFHWLPKRISGMFCDFFK